MGQGMKRRSFLTAPVAAAAVVQLAPSVNFARPIDEDAAIMREVRRRKRLRDGKRELRLLKQQTEIALLNAGKGPL